MSRVIKFHLFDRRRCIVRDMPPTRNVTVIFLHLRLETHASAELDVVFLLQPGSDVSIQRQRRVLIGSLGQCPRILDRT